MAYTNMIDSQLRRAFNLVKDLAEDAVFIRTDAATFDFNKAETDSDDTILPIAKIVVFDGEKKVDGSKRVLKQLMVKAKDVGDLSAYDSVQLGDKTWTIVNPIKGTGFIYVLEIALEG